MFLNCFSAPATPRFSSVSQSTDDAVRQNLERVSRSSQPLRGIAVRRLNTTIETSGAEGYQTLCQQLTAATSANHYATIVEKVLLPGVLPGASNHVSNRQTLLIHLLEKSALLAQGPNTRQQELITNICIRLVQQDHGREKVLALCTADPSPLSIGAQLQALKFASTPSNRAIVRDVLMRMPWDPTIVNSVVALLGKHTHPQEVMNVYRALSAEHGQQTLDIKELLAADSTPITDGVAYKTEFMAALEFCETYRRRKLMMYFPEQRQRLYDLLQAIPASTGPESVVAVKTAFDQLFTYIRNLQDGRSTAWRNIKFVVGLEHIVHGLHSPYAEPLTTFLCKPFTCIACMEENLDPTTRFEFAGQVNSEHCICSPCASSAIAGLMTRDNLEPIAPISGKIAVQDLYAINASDEQKRHFVKSLASSYVAQLSAGRNLGNWVECGGDCCGGAWLSPAVIRPECCIVCNKELARSVDPGLMIDLLLGWLPSTTGDRFNVPHECINCAATMERMDGCPQVTCGACRVSFNLNTGQISGNVVAHADIIQTTEQAPLVTEHFGFVPLYVPRDGMLATYGFYSIDGQRLPPGQLSSRETVLALQENARDWLRAFHTVDPNFYRSRCTAYERKTGRGVELPVS